MSGSQPRKWPMTGKGHEQEESLCLSLKQSTTFRLLSIPAPTNSSTLSLNLRQATLHKDGSLLSFEDCYLKFNKMQILVKIFSIALTHQTVTTSTPSPLFWMWLESSCELSLTFPCFYFKRYGNTVFNTLTFFFSYLLKGIKELFCFRSCRR